MKKVKSLQENIFDYVKSLSVKTFELHRKHIIAHFDELYGTNNSSTLSSIRSATDTVLRYLQNAKFIMRKNDYLYIEKGKVIVLRGYYHFLKEIPSNFTWNMLYASNRK